MLQEPPCFRANFPRRRHVNRYDILRLRKRALAIERSRPEDHADVHIVAFKYPLAGPCAGAA